MITMAKPSLSPGFAALFEEWNKKLEESGFIDDEYTNKGERELKKTGTQNRYKKLDQIDRESRFDYFWVVRDRVNKTLFPNHLEKEIMRLYGEGVSQADIKKRLGIRGHRCKVYRTLYRWLKRWGLK